MKLNRALFLIFLVCSACGKRVDLAGMSVLPPDANSNPGSPPLQTTDPPAGQPPKEIPPKEECCEADRLHWRFTQSECDLQTRFLLKTLFRLDLKSIVVEVEKKAVPFTVEQKSNGTYVNIAPADAGKEKDVIEISACKA